MYRLTTRTRAGTATAIAVLVAIVAGLALPAVAPRGVIQNLFFILTMLTLAGGRERTADEYGALLVAAGLKLAAVKKTASPFSIFEAVPG